VGFVKELDRQDRGQATEDIKIVPLNNVSHGGGNHYAAKVFWDLTGHRVPPLVRLVHRGYGSSYS
jgi:hypothetical protein